MGNFSSISGKKTDSHRKSMADKVELRRLALEAIGPGEARVFDAFAGSGVMFEKVWKGAASYTGCDLKFFRDGRRAFVADNRRVLRSIDLTAFNVFDLDAYGAPWEQALIIARRRPVSPGERIAIVLTEGSGLSLKQQNLPIALKVIAGIDGLPPRGANRYADELLGAAIRGFAARLKCKVLKHWGAEGKSGASMRYCALVMQGAA